MNSVATLTELEIKTRLLITEAKRWVGTKEEGTNSGQVVTLFQNWDGHPDNVPWCMAFVQFCVAAAQHYHMELTEFCSAEYPLRLWPSEHCLTVWNRTAVECRTNTPEAGSIAIWSFTKDGKPTGAGHCGIVTGRKLDGNFFTTIEGNTKDGVAMSREGDGVYERVRNIHGQEGFLLLGFLLPWG